MKQPPAASQRKSSEGNAELAVAVARARLRVDVAKQSVRLAKEDLKRARKRFKEAKREVRRARKAWKQARLTRTSAQTPALTAAKPPAKASVKVAKRVESERNDVVTGRAAERGDHGQAAGILFVRGVIEPGLGRDSAEGRTGQTSRELRQGWRESHVKPSSR